MTIGSLSIKKISLAIGALSLLSAGQSAFAHTIIKNNLTSEVAGYSATYITHGCLTVLPNPLPVIAESVVIPTINPILVRSDNGPITGLGDFFGKAASHSDPTLVPLTTLAGMFTLQQTRDIFTSQTQLHDGPISGGNVIGWVSTRGNLHLNQFGETPFRMSAISFKPNSCARSLKITFAVADVCDVNDWPSTANGPQHTGATNLWLDNTYLNFHGVSIEDGAATPVLTISRDTSLVPYPANCAGAGGSDPLFDVTVKPSQADVEQLQFPGWGPGAPDPSYYY
jgi:hypothetical protein